MAADGTWNDPPIDPRRAKQKRRTRIVLIWFWSVVGVVTVLAVIGSFIPEEEQAAPTATEQRPTTTIAPTTIRQRTTTTTLPPPTTETRMTEQECALWVLAEGVWFQQAGEAVAEMGDWLVLGELEMAHASYTEAKRLYDGTDVGGWLDECGHWDTEAGTVIALESIVAVAAWEDLQQSCHETLKPLGFAC